MNRAIADVYAISIGSKRPGNGNQYTDEDAHKLCDLIPALIDEISRMDRLLKDPFIHGYLEAKRTGCFAVSAAGSP